MKLFLLGICLSAAAFAAKPPSLVAEARGVALDGITQRLSAALFVKELPECEHELLTSIVMYKCDKVDATLEITIDGKVRKFVSNKLRVFYHGTENRFHNYQFFGTYQEGLSLDLTLSSDFVISVHRRQDEMRKIFGTIELKQYKQIIPLELRVVQEH